MSKHKNRNYVNYYARPTYETTNNGVPEDEIVSIPEVEEEKEEEIMFSDSTIDEKEPEIKNQKIPPEEKSEKLDVPMTIVLKTNLFVRETPYGDKVQKDELDRIIASKVIKDGDGWAIVPKETKTEVYDMMVHEDGSIWYATRFGYLLGKTKSGKVYVE